MTEKELLLDSIRVADIHADRLQKAYNRAKKLYPLTPEKFKDIDEVNLAFLELLSSRFGKLQDLIGRKIFPNVLSILVESEENSPLIDNLNKLEKLGYLEDANWWIDMRNLRNKITHDYPDDYDLLAEHFEELYQRAEELLTYWPSLKDKIEKRKI